MILNWAARYQVFLGLLVIAFTIFITGRKVPVIAPPAYAAAGDVYGSPNVTVAAFPAHSSNGDLVLVKVQADGSLTLSLSFPPGVKHFLTDESLTAVGSVFGADRRLYQPLSAFGKTWVVVSDPLP